MFPGIDGSLKVRIWWLAGSKTIVVAVLASSELQALVGWWPPWFAVSALFATVADLSAVPPHQHTFPLGQLLSALAY